MRLGLQAKTTLTLLATLVPLVTLFTVQRAHIEKRDRDEQRLERTITRLISNPDRFCRRAKLPPRAHKQLRGFELTLYSNTFTPRPPQTIELTPTQREQMSELDDTQIAHFPGRMLRDHEPNAPHGYTLAKIEDGGAQCHALLVTWARPGKSLNGPVLRLVFPQAVVLTLLLLISGLLISVPLVRRIKRLTLTVNKATSARHWRLGDVETRSTDELGDLARAFDAAGQEIGVKIAELESRDHTLKEYISNTTHDLAIPLTVIQHRLRRMQRAAHADQPLEAEWINGAIEESHYIASLIANMSALAKLEAGEVHQLQHRVDLGELIERVVARHEPISAQRQLELAWSVPEDPTIVLGDSTLIERALSNLVQNAIQYNDAGGHIAIILEHEPAQMCSMRVMDDGLGVPQDMLDKLGQRAARGDEARNRNPGGQGFGLSIVHKVCTQHGWSVRFESNQDEPGLSVMLDQIKRAPEQD